FAEVAVRGAPGEAAVLTVEWLVEVQLRPHPRDLLGVRLKLAEHHLDRIAGDEEEHREDGEGDANDDRDRREQSRRDIPGHDPPVGNRSPGRARGARTGPGGGGSSGIDM